jgi:hypothetical protein
LQSRTQAEVDDGLKEGEKIAVNRSAGSANQAGNQQRSAGGGNTPRMNRGPQL